MFRTEKPYTSSRKDRSPVQRQTSAAALGYLAGSSVLPFSSLAPKYTEPSETTSCTTFPLLSLTTSLTSRSVRRWSSIASNRPAATAANEVNSPSVPKKHGESHPP